MELVPGAICNLGAGISTGISAVAAEEDIIDLIVLTNEQGFIGGAPVTDPDSGRGAELRRGRRPTSSTFTMAVASTSLSAAEVDPAGNVNISRFGSKIVGIGGFINISQNARKVVFSGTLTAGGLEVACENGQLRIVSEGRHGKFVNAIEQVCYNAPFAEREGRIAVFVTERCLFRAIGGTLELIEVAPGIDVQRDILDRMERLPREVRVLRRQAVFA